MIEPLYTPQEFAEQVSVLHSMFVQRGDLEARRLIADEILKLRALNDRQARLIFDARRRIDEVRKAL